MCVAEPCLYRYQVPRTICFSSIFFLRVWEYSTPTRDGSLYIYTIFKINILASVVFFFFFFNQLCNPLLLPLRERNSSQYQCPII